jgi:uncharacterized membrane protein YbaN (DUF454 family)
MWPVLWFVAGVAMIGYAVIGLVLSLLMAHPPFLYSLVIGAGIIAGCVIRVARAAGDW